LIIITTNIQKRNEKYKYRIEIGKPVLSGNPASGNPEELELKIAGNPATFINFWKSGYNK
jgi:hypothetical protein